MQSRPPDPRQPPSRAADDKTEQCEVNRLDYFHGCCCRRRLQTLPAPTAVVMVHSPRLTTVLAIHDAAHVGEWRPKCGMPSMDAMPFRRQGFTSNMI